MAIHTDQSIKGADVIDILKKLKYEEKEIPKRIQVDNGSEFISKNLDHWADVLSGLRFLYHDGREEYYQRRNSINRLN